MRPALQVANEGAGSCQPPHVILSRFSHRGCRTGVSGVVLKRVAGAILVFLSAWGCSQLKPPDTLLLVQGDGALFVYLQPFPAGSGRLRFGFEEILAVGEDGTRIPLSLFINKVRADRFDRERRLAFQRVPPGRYIGLEVWVGEATLRGEAGTADLLTPQEPVVVTVPFQVGKNRAVVLSLRLDYRKSVGSGFRFTPVILGAIPPRPAPGLIGVVSSRGPDTVTLFDKVSGRVVGIVPTGRKPAGVTMDPARARVYVASSGDDTIEAIDLLEHTVLFRLNLRIGDEPLEMALTPDGRTLLAVNRGSSTVSVIDPETLVETDRIPVGNYPTSILIGPDGRRAWVFNTGSSSLTIIDIPSRAAAQTITTEAGPLRGQFNRAGTVLYVIHSSSPFLNLIDPLSREVIRQVYVGPGATALKVDPRTDRIYLANRNTDSVEIYDPLSFLPVDSIPTDGDVAFLVIDDEGNNLYLVLSQRNQVQAVRLVGKEITARAEIGEDPYGIALAGER